MPQIINETNWGGRLGESLGTGINDALNYLAVKKLNDLSEMKNTQGNLQALLATGYGENEARGIAASKNPQVIAAAIKAGPRGSPEAEKRALAAGFGEPYVAPTIADNLGQLGKGVEAQKPFVTELGKAAQDQYKPTPEQIKQQQVSEENQRYLQQLANPLLSQQPTQPIFGKPPAKEAIKEVAEAVKEAEKPSKYLDLQAALPTAEPPIDPTGLTPAQYKEALTRRHEREREAAKEEEAFWKERLESKRTLPAERKTLKEMIKIAKTGKLPEAKEWKYLTELEENAGKLTTVGGAAGGAIGGIIGGTAGLLGGPAAVPATIAGTALGGGIGSVVGYMTSLYAGLRKSEIRAENPDIERYEKYAASMLKNLPKYFKGPTSEILLTSYMTMVPNLSTSNEGRIRISQDLDKGLELEEKLNATADKIYAQNGYKLPRGFEYLVLQQHQQDVDNWLNDLQETINYAEKQSVKKQ